MKLFTIVASFFLFACATPEKKYESQLNLISEDQYAEIIDTQMIHDQAYDGLYNTIDLKAVPLNSKISLAQVDQTARQYLWDEAKYSEEKSKAQQQLDKESQIFVSFFTPEKKHDDLAKNKTLWKIFIDVDGHRYEGKASKIKLLESEIKGLYSFHNKFSTPYQITFPVAMKNIEGKAIRLTLTGPVGSSSVVFQPKF